jgi:hypothetical protein
MKPLRIPLAIVACALLAACGTAGTGGGGGTAATAEKQVSGGLGQAGSSTDSAAFNSSAGKPNSVDVLQAQGTRQVIQDATLSLRIKSGSFWQNYDKALAIADRYNGYVSSSHIGDQSKAADSGTLVLRIPAASYQDALGALQDLGTTTQLQVSSQDVSEQYVDLNARLKNQQAQQGILLDLMRRASSIQDSIAVQNQLSSVTAEIERIQGQLRFLDSRTNYSTITLNLFVVAPGAVEPTLWERSGLNHSFETAGQVFTAVIGGMIVTAGFLAPFLILLALAFGIWRALPDSIRPSLRKA